MLSSNSSYSASPFASLPYDIVFIILSLIDEKTDLDNLCRAWPEGFGAIVTGCPAITDRIYWREIEDHFLDLLVTLNTRLDTGPQATKLFGDLFQTSEDQASQGGIPIDIHTSGAHKAYIIKSLGADMLSRLQNMHVQVEKLARIFMEHQLGSHNRQSPTSPSRTSAPPGSNPFDSRPPTPEERRRVMEAVYCICSFSIKQLHNIRNLPQLGFFSSRLRQGRGYWNFTATGVLMDVLWESGTGGEISGEPQVKQIPEFAKVAMEQWMKEEMMWAEEKKRNQEHLVTGQYNLEHQFGVDLSAQELRESLDFIFTNVLGSSRQVGGHGGEQAGEDEVADAHIVDRFRETILKRCQSHRLRAIKKGITLWRKKSCMTASGVNVSGPPQRRLVAGPDGTVLLAIPGKEYLGGTEGLWTSADNVMIRDCMWDDWRLKELNYKMPTLAFPTDDARPHG